MLSDHEQRVLDELERDLATGGPRPGRRRSGSPWPPGRVRRVLGVGLLAVLGSAVVFLLFSGVVVAALALAAATALGWLFGRLCFRHVRGAPTSAPPGSEVPTSVRNFLRWLAEAE